MDSSPVAASEEIEGRGGVLGSYRRRPLLRFQPAKRTMGARVCRRTRHGLVGRSKKNAMAKAFMPVRSFVLRTLPLRARSASEAFQRSPTATIQGSPVATSTIQHSVYLRSAEVTQPEQHHFSVEDLPEAILAEIIKRITRTSDLNSLSLVSKRLYTTEADQRGAIHVGCGLCPATEALASLCIRFPNMWKVEIDYSGWTPRHGNQLDRQGFLEFSSRCPSLTDLTLSFCSLIDDSGLGCLAYCKKLSTLRLISTPKITSCGLISVVVSCNSLSALHLVDCHEIGSVEWLEYLGWNGSLEELVVKHCQGIRQSDLLKFGPGWMKLDKFEFQADASLYRSDCSDSSYNAHNPSRYDFCCESLKDLRLARFATGPEIGLRNLLGKCKALEKLCLEYVLGLNDNDLISLSQSCRNLRSISLWLMPKYYDSYKYTTSFTDEGLKALALSCPMLETVELTFFGCSPDWPSEIGFTNKGLVVLIQSCPIRVLLLNGANFFDNEGMKALSSAPFLETLELIDCEAITDVGILCIVDIPCLSNLAIRLSKHVTDGGLAKLVHAQKLESLSIECCPMVSVQALQGAAKSVHYSSCRVSHGLLGKRMYRT